MIRVTSSIGHLRVRLALLAVAAGLFLLLLSGFQVSSPLSALPILRRVFADVAEPQALVARWLDEQGGRQATRLSSQADPKTALPVPHLPVEVWLPAQEALAADSVSLAELVTQQAATRLYAGGFPSKGLLGAESRPVVAPPSLRAWLEAAFWLLNATNHRLLGVGLGLTGLLLAVAAWYAVKGEDLARIWRILGLGLALGVAPLVVGGWVAQMLLERAAAGASDAGAVAAIGWTQGVVGVARDVVRPFLVLAAVWLLGAGLASASGGLAGPGAVRGGGH